MIYMAGIKIVEAFYKIKLKKKRKKKRKKERRKMWLSVSGSRV